MDLMQHTAGTPRLTALTLCVGGIVSISSSLTTQGQQQPGGQEIPGGA